MIVSFAVKNRSITSRRQFLYIQYSSTDIVTWPIRCSCSIVRRTNLSWKQYKQTYCSKKSLWAIHLSLPHSTMPSRLKFCQKNLTELGLSYTSSLYEYIASNCCFKHSTLWTACRNFNPDYKTLENCSFWVWCTKQNQRKNVWTLYIFFLSSYGAIFDTVGENKILFCSKYNQLPNKKFDI